MDNQAISIIVPSVKPTQVIEASVAATCPVKFEFIVVRNRGLAYARNLGAKLAKHSQLLFLDDDISLLSEAWKQILNVSNGEFLMFLPSNARIPCSRLICISAKYFWAIGGFNNGFTISAEDSDFYIRALDAGLTFKPIHQNLVYHYNHKLRIENVHVAIKATKENMVFARKAVHKHLLLLLKVEFFDRIRCFQFATILLNFYWLIRLGASK